MGTKGYDKGTHVPKRCTKCTQKVHKNIKTFAQKVYKKMCASHKKYKICLKGHTKCEKNLTTSAKIGTKSPTNIAESVQNPPIRRTTCGQIVGTL